MHVCDVSGSVDDVISTVDCESEHGSIRLQSFHCQFHGKHLLILTLNLTYLSCYVVL